MIVKELNGLNKMGHLIFFKIVFIFTNIALNEMINSVVEKIFEHDQIKMSKIIYF